MIYREDEDLYRVETLGGELNYELDRQALKDHLSLVNYNNKPLWTKEQIFKVLDMEIGNHTPAPKGIYYD